MIRPLRSRHRAIIAVLAVVVPLVFVLGLLARQPIPAVNETTTAVRPTLPAGLVEVSVSDDAWAGLPVRTTWLEDGGVPPRRAVKLELLEELGRPDLLVYWSEGPAPGDALPGDALLLGAIADGQARAWTLPGAAGGDGRLILYSLARHEVVGVAEAP